MAMNNKLVPLLNNMLQEITGEKNIRFNPNHRMGGLPELSEGEKRESTVYSQDCYICHDPDFRDYGLPLCYPCPFCKGHIAADESVCDVCGKDAREMQIIEGESKVLS